MSYSINDTQDNNAINVIIRLIGTHYTYPNAALVKQSLNTFNYGTQHFFTVVKSFIEVPNDGTIKKTS